MRRRIALGAVLTAALLLSLSSCTVLRCVLMKHNTGHGMAHISPACGGWEPDPPVDGMKVYVKGDRAHPPILLLHELPGSSPETLCFANDLVERGYRVYMPLFFGKLGEGVGTARQMAVCAGPNFNCLSSKESRVVRKLRTLRDRIAAAHGDQKLGVIGMCLTGGMPLALADEKVAAVVLSQPSIPFPFTQHQRRSLGVSETSLQRAAAAGVAVLRIRFACDCLVPAERFATIESRFDRLETIVVPSDDPREHSVLTGESHGADARAAIRSTYDFLDRHVKGRRDGAATRGLPL